nr:MAG TPA: Protein of unknown function (DUF1642) [Caudoviricetes sp.]
MNKQELIGKYEYLNHNYFRMVDTSEVLRDLKQLDEPQKVVVPQFVADWYEKHKDDLEYDIWEYILHWGKQQKSEFYEWMNHANNKPFQTLVNMHQFGYEVEKEKRYKVVIKETKQPLYYNASDDKLFFSMGKIASHFTRQQLEKLNFGWVFDCPATEVLEVE